MIVLAPGTRYGGPDSVRDTVFRGRRAIGVVFHDTLGGPVVEYFARRDTLPLGFTFPDREVAAPGSVSLVLSQWGAGGWDPAAALRRVLAGREGVPVPVHEYPAQSRATDSWAITPVIIGQLSGGNLASTGAVMTGP